MNTEGNDQLNGPQDDYPFCEPDDDCEPTGSCDHCGSDVWDYADLCDECGFRLSESGDWGDY